MANKCGHCGKFISQTDGVKCSKCTSTYHRPCVNISPESRISQKWICKTCKIPRQSPVPADYCIEVSVDSRVESHIEGLLAKEIKLLRTELKTLSEEMVSFRQEIAKLNTSMTQFNSRLDSVETRVTSLEQQTKEGHKSCNNNELVDIIARLKRDLNIKEQAALSNDLELTGIPEQKGESPGHLMTLVAKKLDVELDERDVVSVERAGMRRNRESSDSEPPRPRVIVVRLARRSVRDQLLRAARVRRGADTSGFNINGEQTRFYLNERLTYANKHLFHRARQEARRCNWRYAWTKNGVIFVKRDSMSSKQKICMDCDIEKVFGSS
ncbi:unnamed protein product [Parnassius mnemosyne]|uniref:Phorbol-ester/DAG-type domain-containing protein n=1 Tax=Parnassius mnemosyne TaxID=213953 RepID=A0AAV1LW00_9NEOP